MIEWSSYGDVLPTFIVLLVLLAGAAYKLSHLMLFRRKKLMTDLDILKNLYEFGEDDFNTRKIEKQIQKEMKIIYREKSLYDLIGGFSVFIGSLLSLIYLVYSDHLDILRYPLIGVATILLLGGLGGISQYHSRSNSGEEDNNES